MIVDSLVEQDQMWLISQGAYDVDPEEFSNMVNYAMAEGVGEEAARKASLDVLVGMMENRIGEIPKIMEEN